MRYFKLNDQVFAYDVDQEHLVTEDMIEILGDELDAILNPPPPPPTAFRLTNYQLRMALIDSDLLIDLESKIDEKKDQKERLKLKTLFEYLPVFSRDDDFIQLMIDMLEITPDNMDEIWEQALEF